LSVSIKDVALRAGVSTATVSHILNSTRVTSQATRNRVLAAIQELGYSQNQAARNLARGRSSLLGLLISDIRNPFFPEITAAFQDQALAHNMDALVLNTNYDPQRTLNSVRRLMGLQVPGVAILTSQIDPAIVDMLRDSKIAAVYLDLGQVAPNVCNLVVDYAGGIAQVLDHLTRLGHRRIAYIGGPPHLPSARVRKRAFLETAHSLNIEPEDMIDSDFTVKGGYFAASKLLGSRRPTAVVAGNDLTAIGVLHRAYDGRIRVPEDLSVVGFDDIVFAEYTQPALSTVTVPRTEIGTMAFQALWSTISDPEHAGQEFRLGTQLTLRQSTMAPLND
jgi:DNA-binding LacI/PurR family transcriptional regulator